MSLPRPIEVVGGGVAGLALGIALRRARVPVVVYEAGEISRHRVCGEFISGLEPSTRATLGLDQVLGDAAPHRTVTYHVRGRALRPFPLPAPAWGISRPALDSRLAAVFEAAGGELRRHTRVAEDDAPEGRVFAAGRRRQGQFWVGLKVHVGNLALEDDFEVHLGNRAYVGLSRTETGLVNLCGIFAPRGVTGHGLPLLLASLRAADLQGLAQRVEAADPQPESCCVTAAPFGDHRVENGSRLRIGDACASIPPFTGNGLAMALQGAETAAGPLGAYAEGRQPWAATVAAVHRQLDQRFRRRLRVATWLHPFLLEPGRQTVLAALARSGLLPFRALYGLLH